MISKVPTKLPKLPSIRYLANGESYSIHIFFETQYLNTLQVKDLLACEQTHLAVELTYKWSRHEYKSYQHRH